ncbi:MAG: hypothetical protein HDR03_14945 [Lachnospiraceae bacterium]|nr:hypothetical protein [Lachnospiraceae bacterium]
MASMIKAYQEQKPKIDINTQSAIDILIAVNRGEGNVFVNQYGLANIREAYREQLVNIAERITNDASAYRQYSNFILNFKSQRKNNKQVQSIATSIKELDKKIPGVLKDKRLRRFEGQQKKKIALITQSLNDVIVELERQNEFIGTKDLFRGYVNRNVNPFIYSFKEGTGGYTLMNAQDLVQQIRTISYKVNELARPKNYKPTGRGREFGMSGSKEKAGYKYFDYNVADIRIANLFKALNSSQHPQLLKIVSQLDDKQILRFWKEYEEDGNIFQLVFEYGNAHSNERMESSSISESDIIVAIKDWAEQEGIELKEA